MSSTPSSRCSSRRRQMASARMFTPTLIPSASWTSSHSSPPLLYRVPACSAVATSLAPRRASPATAGEGDVRRDERAAVGRALDPEPAVEDGKPVAEPQQAAPAGPGASDAVVAHPDLEGAVRDAHGHGGARCPRVFGDVGERLGDDE